MVYIKPPLQNFPEELTCIATPYDNPGTERIRIADHRSCKVLWPMVGLDLWLGVWNGWVAGPSLVIILTTLRRQLQSDARHKLLRHLTQPLSLEQLFLTTRDMNVA